jgi:hypothetical protein
MFSANEPFDGQLDQHEPDRRAAGTQILSKRPFGRQAISRGKRRAGECPDGRFHSPVVSPTARRTSSDLVRTRVRLGRLRNVAPPCAVADQADAQIGRLLLREVVPAMTPDRIRRYPFLREPRIPGQVVVRAHAAARLVLEPLDDLNCAST